MYLDRIQTITSRTISNSNVVEFRDSDEPPHLAELFQCRMEHIFTIFQPSFSVVLWLLQTQECAQTGELVGIERLRERVGNHLVWRYVIWYNNPMSRFITREHHPYVDVLCDDSPSRFLIAPWLPVIIEIGVTMNKPSSCSSLRAPSHSRAASEQRRTQLSSWTTKHQPVSCTSSWHACRLTPRRLQ